VRDFLVCMGVSSCSPGRSIDLDSLSRKVTQHDSHKSSFVSLYFIQTYHLRLKKREIHIRH
jgi:hypothetical protein